VQQATKVERFIKTTTKALGRQVPGKLIALADQVIEVRGAATARAASCLNTQSPALVAVRVTLVRGAGCADACRAECFACRGGESGNAGQGNRGGQDESDETHVGPRFGSVQPRHAVAQAV